VEYHTDVPGQRPKTANVGTTIGSGA
jgi:hypothetical protein